MNTKTLDNGAKLVTSEGNPEETAKKLDKKFKKDLPNVDGNDKFIPNVIAESTSKNHKENLKVKSVDEEDKEELIKTEKLSADKIADNCFNRMKEKLPNTD